MNRTRTLLFIVALIAVFGYVLYGSNHNFPKTTDAAFLEKKESGSVEKASGLPLDIPELVDQVKNTVVNISTTTKVKISRPHFRDPFGNSPFEKFFDEFFGKAPRERKRRALGSGFILTEDGYILTNNHVVEKADEIRVKLFNEKEYKAEVVGKDPKTDIALIKIDNGSKLPHVDLGNSDSLRVGEWVVAIGNPFGLSHTVTTGIVSAKGRVIGSGPYDDFIQTDASINPGNSGGPLFDLTGRVVGINTMIIASGQGIGFAIPVNLAKQVVAQLKKSGKVTRGWLGVYIQDVTPEMAKSLDIPTDEGAIVTEVMENSPAGKGGLKQGDVIIRFNGKKVKDAHHLPTIVANTSPGTKVSLKVFRDGKEFTLEIKVGEMEQGMEVAGGTGTIGELGLALQDISKDIATQLGIKDRDGVIVTGVEPGSPAGESGIRQGDIIRQVNREPVKDLREFRETIAKSKNADSVLFLVERESRRIFIVVKKK